MRKQFVLAVAAVLAANAAGAQQSMGASAFAYNHFAQTDEPGYGTRRGGGTEPAYKSVGSSGAREMALRHFAADDEAGYGARRTWNDAGGSIVVGTSGGSVGSDLSEIAKARLSNGERGEN